MVVREIHQTEKGEFNALAGHPLQSFEWGEFRQKTGVKVVRLGVFDPDSVGEDREKLKASYQITIHPLPIMGMSVGYFPKGPMPDAMQVEVIEKIGRENNCVFVKLEPNVSAIAGGGDVNIESHQAIREFLLARGCKEGRPLFTKYTFQVDLTKSETELKAAMKPKTRYNIGVAQKYRLEVKEENSPEAFGEYIKLVEETTRRQGFYSHDEQYHKIMWESLSPSGIARLVLARWQGKVLAAWMVFVFNGVIYYPYGASSNEHREVMASNLMMWEVMRLGKSLGCKALDMWGALGPNPDQKHPWYGFHKFKEGYGGTLREFVGSFDLVLKKGWYPMYRWSEDWRWRLLRLKAKLM